MKPRTLPTLYGLNRLLIFRLPLRGIRDRARERLDEPEPRLEDPGTGLLDKQVSTFGNLEFHFHCP